MQLATDNYWRDMVIRVTNAQFGGKAELLAEAKRLFGVSRNTFYRTLAEYGYSSGRTVRKDTGKTSVTEAEMLAVAKIMLNSNRANKKRLTSLEQAMAIARAAGQLCVQISPSQMSRQLAVRGLLTKQLNSESAYQPLRSLHPNHVWQIDVSLCVLYYMDGSKGLGVMEENQFYKNKPHNLQRIEKQRVLRYLVTDHTSSAFYCHYYIGSGETTELMFDFLMRAMHRREGDPGMHGVPKMLVWDCGSANQSAIIKSLLDALGVQHYAHVPGNPRAKGQVEKTHDLVERGFEGTLSLGEPVKDIKELNRRADKWRLAFNASAILRRAQAPRYQLWHTIAAEQLIDCPPMVVCQSLLRSKKETRRIQNDLTIQYQIDGYPSYHYSVAHINNIRLGEQIELSLNPFSLPNVIAYKDGIQHSLAPLEKDQYGFYQQAAIIGEEFKSKPDTIEDKARKAVAETPLNIKDPLAHVDPAYAQLHQYHARKGTSMRLESNTDIEQRYTPLQAYKWVEQQLGDRFAVIKKGLYQELKKKANWRETELIQIYVNPVSQITEAHNINTATGEIHWN